MPIYKDVTLAKKISESIRSSRIRLFPGHGGQRKAAEAFGIDYGVWNKWEAGRKVPTEANQRRLAEFFGIPVGELRGDWPSPAPNESTESVDISGVNKRGYGDFIIPVMALALAAEDGSEVHIDPDARPDPTRVPAGVLSVEVKGDSAEPVARSGQHVLVAPEGRNPRHGDLVVIDASGTAGDRILFKRWFGYSPEGDRVLLGSINTAHPPVFLDRRRLRRVLVAIGVLFE